MITILSDSTVRVRPVEISARSIEMFAQHAADDWYEPAAWRGSSFLVLSEDDQRKLDTTWLQRRLGEPARSIACGKTMIVEYPYNIAARLAGYVTAVEIPLDASTPRQVGRFDAGARTLKSAAGEAGYLVFGPYMPLKKGAYEATVRITSGEVTGGTTGTVDIVAGKGTKILARRDVGAEGPQEVRLPFALDADATDLEIRVHATGRGTLAVQGPIELRNTATNTVGGRTLHGISPTP